MRIRTGWMGTLQALCALGCLVMSFGAARAADQSSLGGAVVESGDVAGPQSISPGKVVVDTEGVPDLVSPTVGSCTGPVVPFDGATSINGRAPVARYAAARGHYLILQSELAAAGITGTTSISGIGWRYAAAPGVAGSAPLKIYLENVAASEVVNNKTATWATAIGTMTLVHNATTALPNSTTAFDITFSAGSFSYTGGALYVAFDWGPYAGTLGAAATVSCNSTGLAAGREKQANSAAATLGANSAFGPETRLTALVGSNDASVVYVISLGSLAQPLVGPQTVQAVVTNKGASALSNLPVTFNLTGAEIFSNTQNVATLAACGGTTTVTFAPFTPSAIGSDTVTVSVPADDNNANNSGSKPLNETFNLYSYKHPGTTASGGVGVNSPNTADFVAKFTTTVAAKVSAVSIEFPLTSTTTYRVAIYPDSGSGTPGLVPLYEDAVDRTVTVAGPVTITLPTPVAVGPGNFYAGVQQTNTTNMGLGFDTEVPIRAGSFYLAVPHPATAWTDFAPGNNFKLNIGVTLIQCAAAAECNDGNPCTNDACTNNLCTHTNNSATSCDGNACSDPDQCLNGVCIPGPNPCNDNNACTVDLCAGGGGCTNTPVDCNDNNPCTNDFCVPATGCGHSNNTNACTDNNLCTIGDACSGGVCLPGTGALPAPVSTCNTGGITIPSIGTATPYPSAITLSGLPTYLCKATVNVNGITHTFLDDVDILLSSPTPTTNLIILSDVTGAPTGLNLTFDDAAATTVPGSPASGTYKPTNVGAGDPFAAPAPTPSAATTLATFKGVNPNGTWNLWVVDDFTGDSGSITGWCLNLVSICTADADCSDGNPCTNDACANSPCTHTNNTHPCNDNNACTANDTCSGGVCVGGAPPACDDGNACTANTCNAGTGLCENPAIVCNDNNTCTDDTCNTGTGCVFTANDANPCSDNNLCTTPDVCVAGVCVGQNPVVCPPDANVCTTEACNPATGLCGSTNNTNACDDGNVCTSGDTCGPALAENFDGETAPNLPGTWATGVTGTGNPWTAVSTSSDTPPNSAFGFDGPAVADEELVSPVFNVATASAQLTFRNRWTFESATTCFDGGVLEIDIAGGGFTDIVTAGGSFVSGGYNGTVSASFSNPLASRSAWCNASAGYPAYLSTVVNLPAAAAGQPVQLRWRVGTDTSTGAAGQNIDSILVLDGSTYTCLPGTGVLDCNDGNPCTDDSCDPVLGCQHSNNTDPCDDGNQCTILDRCAAGSCGGTAVVCNDSNACTTDTCSPTLGCVFTNNTAACDDGNPCTAGDTCGGGVCSGTPITAPAEVQNVTAAADKATYNWAAAASATQYDVVRGSVSALPVGPGGGDEVCFGSLAGTTVTDATNPGPGGAFWYLSRGKNTCGTGTYGNQGFHGAPAALRVTTTCP